MASIDWAGANGDVWSRWWRSTDRGLAPVGRALDAAILDAAPGSAFRALDIGCGPGTTAIGLHLARPEATILGCDLSQSLVEVARARCGKGGKLQFVVEDAIVAAPARGPFDLMFSRHGVMFFEQPVAAFAALRHGAAPGAPLVFSCFRDWGRNPWASELAAAALGVPAPDPGIEPGGFAFADPAHVEGILRDSGWSEAHRQALDFDYVAGDGKEAVDDALAYLSEIGPAARLLPGPGEEREEALGRMRHCLQKHCEDAEVRFAASAWIWTVRA